MPYRTLADFLEELGRDGELARVDAEVSPSLEVAEISRRMARQEGPALLFGAAAGHDLPVLTQLLGTEPRICRALGVESLGEAAARMERLLRTAEPDGWFDRLRVGAAAGPLGGLTPRQVKSGACQQVVRLGSDVNLEELPLLQSSSEETGRTISAATVLTAEPDSHGRVAGRYDLVLLGRDRLAVCWPAHEEPARLVREYGRREGRMPLAVVLGGDPACWLAASAAVSPAIDPWALAGLLRERPIDLVACRSVDLAVPAETDIVLEGYVDPAEPPVAGGPLCAVGGYMSPPWSAPVLHVTAVTHRANPIYRAVVSCAMPNEACVADRALSQIFLPLARLAIPELVDYDLPLFGAARHWAVLAIRKSYAGQARRVASIAWGMRQFLFAKLLVIVDEGVDVRDARQVLGAMAARANPGRDLFFQEGPPDPLDPAAVPGSLGQKMAVDATAKLAEEAGGTLSEPATIGRETRDLVTGRWEQYGLGVEGGEGGENAKCKMQNAKCKM